MRRLIFLLAIWLMIGHNLCSELVIKLDGSQGSSLFRDLTNNTTSNATDAAKSGDLLNLSSGTASVELGGDKGSTIFENLTINSSLNRLANDSDKGLDSWGSTPRKTPRVPTYDPSKVQTIDVLRQNHGF
ncbi:Uncharacterised protein [uncultured archaeon]|nr:Uncharacterised protein [uncultured archaeon]